MQGLQLPFEISSESLMTLLVLPAMAGYTELRLKYASKEHAQAVKSSLTADINEIKVLLGKVEAVVEVNISTSKEVHAKLEENIEAINKRLLELERHVS